MASIETITRKLRDLKMPAMADHLDQLYSSKEFSAYSTLEIVEQLIEQEQISRRNHTIERRIKQAGLTDSQARLEAIDYRAERNINHSLIDQLKTNDYIIGTEYKNSMEADVIECGLKQLDEDCVAECIINPATMFGAKNKNYNEFLITKDRELKDKILRLGFNITNYRNIK